jgi:hypothetical protein
VDTPVQAATVSDLVIEGAILSIDAPRLNTDGGVWDPGSPASDDLHDEYANLVPWTDILVSVGNVLGATKDAQRTPHADASEVLLSLAGGTVRFTVSPEQASAIGLAVQPTEPTGGLDGVPVPASSFSVDSLALELSMPYAANLTVGDRIVVFVRFDTMNLADGETRGVLIAATPEGAGLFLSDASAPDVFVNAVTGRPYARSEVLTAIDSLTSRPSSQGPSSTP